MSYFSFWRKGFLLFIMMIMLAVGLLYIAFTMLRHVPSKPTLMGDFMDFEFCQMTFWHFWEDYLAFTLDFVSVMDHMVDLWLLNYVKVLRINPTWFLFICCWIQFANILLRMSICIHEKYWPVIFYECSAFVWFLYQGNSGFVEWIWECCSLFNFFLIVWKD